VTIAGKCFHHRLTPLGRFRYPAFFLAFTVILLAVFIPLLLLVWQTLMLYPNDYSLGNLTLHFWSGASDPALAEGESGILRNRQILGAALNSIELSVLAAVITGMIGLFIGYAVVKGRRTWLANLVEQGSFLPYLIPSIAFGAIYLAIFTRPVGPLPSLSRLLKELSSCPAARPDLRTLDLGAQSRPRVHSRAAGYHPVLGRANPAART